MSPRGHVEAGVHVLHGSGVVHSSVDHGLVRAVVMHLPRRVALIVHKEPTVGEPTNPCTGVGLVDDVGHCIKTQIYAQPYQTGGVAQYQSGGGARRGNLPPAEQPAMTTTEARIIP